MSTSSPQAAAAAPGGADPSMEDILASIRRILSEDENAEQAAAPAPAAAAAESDVLALDASMMVEESAPPPPAPAAARAPEPPPPAPAPPAPAIMHEPMAAPPPMPPSESLLGEEATDAAASSVGALLRTLVSERQHVAVYRGGPTIEDLVREEIRPLLKQWLDVNLPPMVERLVRLEIERVVLRAVT